MRPEKGTLNEWDEAKTKDLMVNADELSSNQFGNHVDK